MWKRVVRVCCDAACYWTCTLTPKTSKFCTVLLIKNGVCDVTFGVSSLKLLLMATKHFFTTTTKLVVAVRPR